MFGLGPMEMGIIAVVLVLLFGSRLPSLMRSLGSGIVEFKKGMTIGMAEIDDVKNEVKNAGNQVRNELTAAQQRMRQELLSAGAQYEATVAHNEEQVAKRKKKQTS